MSYSYKDTTWSDPLDMPLGAYESLTFEDFENYLETQTANPYSSPKRPQQPQPIASTSSPIPTSDSNAYSSSIYFASRASSLPELFWTSDAFHPIPHPSPFATPLLEDDYAFFANIDLPPLDSNLPNVATNPQVPHSPEPVVRHPPSKKRLCTNEESECPDNTSNDASFNHKRRKLSIDSHQNLPDVPPPTNFHNSSSNAVSDTCNNFNLSVGNDNAFLANIDPSLLNSNLFNVTTNPSIPHVPEPGRHLSPPPRNLKRPFANEEPDLINVSNGTSANPTKRHKLSTDRYKDLSTIPPPPGFFDNNSSNAIPDIVNNGYVPAYVPAPTLSTNAILPQPYPNPNMFHNVPAPFVNTSPAPPAARPLPSAYVPSTQPGFNVMSRANKYPSGLVVDPNNLYTAAGDCNNFPWGPLSYLTPPEVENSPFDRMLGLPGSKNIYSATAPGASVPTLVPAFLGQQAPSGVPHNNVIYTDTYANMHSGVDICQHSRPTNSMSMTGHTAKASMPSTCMPSTRAASSAEPILTYKFYQPTLSPPSPPSPPTPASRPTQARPKRHGPQLVPARHLWKRCEDGTFVCLYKGPAKPDGCCECPTSLRNLGRHMRTHACAEDGMSIPQAEKIAFNGLPDDLRIKVATCSLDDAELHHCAYFRKHGKRWEEETLKRPDGMLRQHENWNHPPEYRRIRKAKSRKKRSAKS